MTRSDGPLMLRRRWLGKTPAHRLRKASCARFFKNHEQVGSRCISLWGCSRESRGVVLPEQKPSSARAQRNAVRSTTNNVDDDTCGEERSSTRHSFPQDSPSTCWRYTPFPSPLSEVCYWSQNRGYASYTGSSAEHQPVANGISGG